MSGLPALPCAEDMKRTLAALQPRFVLRKFPLGHRPCVWFPVALPSSGFWNLHSMSCQCCFRKRVICQRALVSIMFVSSAFMQMQAVLFLDSVVPMRMVLQTSSICMPRLNGQNTCSETARLTPLDIASEMQHGDSNEATGHCPLGQWQQRHCGEDLVDLLDTVVCCLVLVWRWMNTWLACEWSESFMDKVAKTIEVLIVNSFSEDRLNGTLAAGKRERPATS